MARPQRYLNVTRPETLLQVRADALEETVRALRGGDVKLGLQLARLVAQVDERLERVVPDPLARRQLIASQVDPTPYTGYPGGRGR